MVSSASDLMVEHSRRQLWVALVLVALLAGASALAGVTTALASVLYHDR